MLKGKLGFRSGVLLSDFSVIMRRTSEFWFDLSTTLLQAVEAI